VGQERRKLHKFVGLTQKYWIIRCKLKQTLDFIKKSERGARKVRNKYSYVVIHIFIGLAITVNLSACASVPGQETKAFENGTKAVQTASDLLLDQINAAEKNTGLRLAKKTISFRIDDAYYYSTIPTDEPITSKFRHAIMIISDYATLLQNLIQGTGNEEARAQIISIASNVAALSGQPEFAAAAQAFTPFIDQGLLLETRAEARELATVGAPAIHTLISEIRLATPAMFDILRADIISKEGPASPKLELYKETLGNFVVLLDKLEITFDTLLAAYQQPSSTYQLESLAEATGELNAGVKTMRHTFAERR
jgi:hypothetical protein